MPCGAVLLLPNCKLASLAMARRVTLVDACSVASTPQQPTTTDWELCVVCQEVKGEPLTSPSLSKRQDVGRGYKTLAENLIKFDQLEKLPKTLQLDRIDEGEGIEAAMVANQVKWHHTCRLRYNNTMLQRAEKRANLSVEDTEDSLPPKRNSIVV